MNSYDHVAAFAEREGYGNYNFVINLMEADGMIPGYENKTFDIYCGVGRDYGYGETLSEILDAYAVEYGPGPITL